MLDTPLKMAALAGALVALRIILALWRSAPRRSSLVELANSALIAFGLVFLLIRPFLLQAFFIPSASMEPTLHMPDLVTGQASDRILVNRFIYRLGPPRRGDIIVFRAPKHALESARGAHREQGTDWVKRVIGLPGDRIQVIGGVGVKVNGRLLSEPYASEKPLYDFPFDPAVAGSPRPYVVPAGCLFVMGDNRNASADSRWWRDASGASRPELPIRNVIGRSLIVFWPLNRVGHLTR